MNSRRKFIKNVALGTAAAAISPKLIAKSNFNPTGNFKPAVVSTWNHGLPANGVAWKIISDGGKAIDAVEKGVMIPESDPKVTSVGYGGLPDRDGNVTLDACIMDEKGNCGAVAFLQHIKNPISVARKVMDDTPHTMISGKGALDFALSKGFNKENLLTPEAKARWEKWKKEKNYQPIIDIENHDTIGMIALDKNGNLSGACTTSGLAWKMHGRVGDSPIIGAGLFVDNEVGAATATGKGEAVVKIAGTAIIVEMMRMGKSPQEACELAIKRISEKQSDYKDFQVGFLAINKKGEVGAYSIQKGFNYAMHNEDGKNMNDAPHLLQTNVRTY